MAEALEVEIAALPQGSRRDGLSKRVRAYRACGTALKHRACEACGHGRAASGRWLYRGDPDAPPGAPHPCQARSCSFCQRRRATKLSSELVSKIKGAELPQGQSWLFVTLSPQYDPSDESELDAKGLRARFDGIWSAFRALMNAGKATRKKAGWISGAFAAVELAGTGHVHLHALVAARWIDQDWLNELASEACGRNVFSWIEKASTGTVAEVAKYVAKLVSPLDEAALSGAESRTLSDPRLLAAWEVATFSRRVHERYGILRGSDEADEVEVEIEDDPKDSTASCERCGVVGDFCWRVVPTRAWLSECRRRGVQALERSVQKLRRKRSTQSAWDKLFYG